MFRLPVGDLLSGSVTRAAFASSARFKAPANASQEKLFAYARYAEGIAAIVLHARPTSGRSHPVGTDKPSAPAWTGNSPRSAAGGSSTPPTSATLFLATLRHLHSLNIPVIALRDPGWFHGACFYIEDRVAIVIKSQGESSSKWLNDLVHEAPHTDKIRTAGIRTRLELGEIGKWSDDPEEIAANNFAADVSFEGRAQPVLRMVLSAVGGWVPQLKSELPALAQQAEVPVDVLANYLAYQLSERGLNWWPTALTFHTKDTPWRTAVDELLPMIRFAELVTHPSAQSSWTRLPPERGWRTP